MTIEQSVAAVEAILFSSGEPVALARLALALDITEKEASSLCDLLADRLSGENSGITLVRTEDRVQLCAKSEYAELVRAALEMRRPAPLSQAAMEVLTIIAYRQPVTRTYIEQVRGVDSTYTVSTLAGKGLIEECGRLEVPGRPLLYRTTDLFLRTFGLSSLSELPPLPPELHDKLPEKAAADGE